MVVSEDEEFRRVSYDKFATLKPAFQKDNGEFPLVHWDWKSCPHCSLIVDHCCFSLQDWQISEVEHKEQVKTISLVLRAHVSHLTFLSVFPVIAMLRCCNNSTVVSCLF